MDDDLSEDVRQFEPEVRSILAAAGVETDVNVERMMCLLDKVYWSGSGDGAQYSALDGLR